MVEKLNATILLFLNNLEPGLLFTLLRKEWENLDSIVNWVNPIEKSISYWSEP